jgi:hypothetical protein
VVWIGVLGSGRGARLGCAGDGGVARATKKLEPHFNSIATRGDLSHPSFSRPGVDAPMHRSPTSHPHSPDADAHLERTLPTFALNPRGGCCGRSHHRSHPRTPLITPIYRWHARFPRPPPPPDLPASRPSSNTTAIAYLHPAPLPVPFLHLSLPMPGHFFSTSPPPTPQWHTDSSS